MRKLQGICCDVNGVLFDSDGKGGGVAIENSIAAVEKLYNKNIPIRFVTNESQHGPEDLHKKLQKLGFSSIPLEHIYSPLIALRDFLTQRPHLKPYFLMHPGAMALVQDLGVANAENANCVVLGDAAEHFTYPALNTCFEILMKSTEKDCPLITLGTGGYYKQGTRLVLDVGAFTVALEYASGKKARVIGKPSTEFYLQAVRIMGLSVPTEEVLMIGDDIVVDVGGGQAAGMFAVQVRTGKYQQSRDEPHVAVHPDAYVDNLWQAVNLYFS